MIRTVLIVGAGSVQMAGIRRAKEMGLRVVAADADPDAPGLQIADVPVVIDIRDVEKMIALARAYRVVGVLCIAVEVGVKTVAEVARALGLLALSPAAAENATDKHRMRTLWAQAGLASPASCPCRTQDEASGAMQELGLPVVIKPSDGAGSWGVSRVDKKGQLGAAFERARAASRSGLVLVEEYMPGVEMSVEAFVHRGVFHAIALSDKTRTPPPYLLDTAVLFPSEQPDWIQREACELVARAARVLGIDMAPIHAEVMVTPHGPMMVELAARGPGFKVFTDMIPWTSGVDGVRELIRMSLAEEPDLTPKFRRGAVLLFPHAPHGRVRNVEGLDEARRIPGVVDVDLYVHPDDEVKPLTSGSDRVGHVIALAETRAEATRAARAAEQALVVDVEPVR